MQPHYVKHGNCYEVATDKRQPQLIKVCNLLQIIGWGDSFFLIFRFQVYYKVYLLKEIQYPVDELIVYSHTYTQIHSRTESSLLNIQRVYLWSQWRGPLPHLDISMAEILFIGLRSSAILDSLIGPRSFFFL